MNVSNIIKYLCKMHNSVMNQLCIGSDVPVCCCMSQLAQDLQKHPPLIAIFLPMLISPGRLHLPAVLGATYMRSLGQMEVSLSPDKQALLDRYLDSTLRHSTLWR